MKKQLLFFILIVAFHSARSQGGDGNLLQKCCIDSQTGDTIRATFWNRIDISNDYLLNLRMTRSNSTYAIELRYHFGRGEPFTISRGDSIWIKFISGYKIPLYTDDSVTSRRGGAMIPGEIDGAVTLGVSVKYNISPTQIFAFIGNEIEKIRIFSSKGYNDINWPSKTRYITVRGATLMMEKRKNIKICEAEADQEPTDKIKEKITIDNF